MYKNIKIQCALKNKILDTPKYADFLKLHLTSKSVGIFSLWAYCGTYLCALQPV